MQSITSNNRNRINLSLFISPHFYLHGLNEATREATFVQMSRASYQQSAFLDDRIVRGGSDQFSVGIGELLDFFEASFGTQRKISYIFHTAFCGSTLLSRAMDISDHTMVYREPVPLHQMAMLKREASLEAEFDKPGWERWLRLLGALLARTALHSEAAIVKPTDSCNSIIPDLLALHGDSKGLVMYDDLEGFLISSLKAKSRRHFVREVLGRSAIDARSVGLLADMDTTDLSDARTAAFVWVSQMQVCNAAINRHPDKLRSLSIENFLDSPQKTLERLTAYFGIDIPGQALEEISRGPVFKKHAKTDVHATYDSHTRTREKLDLAYALRDEIDDGMEWVRSVGFEPNMRLPGALFN